MNKKEILRLAIKLEVPLDLTWSCHEDGQISCGICAGCINRLKTFKDLKIQDKLEYENL